jgi:hypothetical protein
LEHLDYPLEISKKINSWRPSLDRQHSRCYSPPDNFQQTWPKLESFSKTFALTPIKKNINLKCHNLEYLERKSHKCGLNALNKIKTQDEQHFEKLPLSQYFGDCCILQEITCQYPCTRILQNYKA